MGLRSLQPLIPGSKPRSQGTARSPSRHQSRKRSPGGPLVAACDSCNKQDSAPRRPSRTAPYSWKPKQSPAWPRPARMTDLLSVPHASHQAMWLHPRSYGSATPQSLASSQLPVPTRPRPQRAVPPRPHLSFPKAIPAPAPDHGDLFQPATPEMFHSPLHCTP